MAENNGPETIDWVIYRDPAGFAELSRLNAGVILEPLVSMEPAEEIHPYVGIGLSLMSSKEVKKVIADHTEPGEEYKALLKRYKDIKHSIPSGLLGGYGYPVAEAATSDASAQTQARQTPEEIYSKLLFGKGEPDYDKIAPVMARNPKSPDNITFLEELFAAQGYDLDDPINNEVRIEFSTAVAKAIGKFMFNPRRPLTERELCGMAVDWVSKLGDARFLRGVGLRLGGIKAFMNNVDPYNQNVDTMLALARSVIEASNNLSGVLEEKPAMGIALISKIEELLFERFKKYGSVEIAYLKDSLGRDSLVTGVSPFLANAIVATDPKIGELFYSKNPDEEAAA